MKKRLLITSIVMMLVVAVALSTATYAWFTSNANVSATAVVLTASTADGDAIMISHNADNTGLSSTVVLTAMSNTGRLYPATPTNANAFTTELDSDETTEAEILADVLEALPDQFQNLIMKGAGTYVDPEIESPNVSFYTDTIYVYNKGTVAKSLVPTITINHTTDTISLLAAKSARIALIERKGSEVASGDVEFDTFTLRGIYEFDDTATTNVYDAVGNEATFDDDETYYTYSTQTEQYSEDDTVTDQNFAEKKSSLFVIGKNRKTIAKNGANGSSTDASGYGVVGNGPYTRGNVLFAPNTSFATIDVPTSGHYVANAYTIVIWLEGWDDDCTNSITAGSFSVGLDFSVGA